MNYPKRVAALALALAALLAGCGKAPTEEPTEEPAKELVYAITAGGEYYRFPVIDLDFPEAVRINAEVLSGERAEDRIDFYYALHGETLSLILCRAFGSFLLYQTYHMNTKTGAPVTNRELLSLAGWEEEELLANLRRKLAHFYEGTENLPADFPHAEYRAKMLAELEDVESMRLYFSRSGRLFWVSQLASMGGPLFYEVLMDPAQPDEFYSGDNHELTGRWEVLA